MLILSSGITVDGVHLIYGKESSLLVVNIFFKGGTHYVDMLPPGLDSRCANARDLEAIPPKYFPLFITPICFPLLSSEAEYFFRKFLKILLSKESDAFLREEKFALEAHPG